MDSLGVRLPIFTPSRQRKAAGIALESPLSTAIYVLTGTPSALSARPESLIHWIDDVGDLRQRLDRVSI